MTSSLSARVATITFVACAVVVAFLTVAIARDVILLGFGGVLFAVGVRAAADRLRRHTPLSPGASVLVVVLALAALVAGVILGLAPGIARESREMVDTLPGAVDRLREWLASSTWGKELLALVSQLKGSDAAGPLSSVPKLVAGFLGALGGGILVIVVGLYLAVDPAMHIEGALQLVPMRGRERTRAILAKMGHVLRAWLVGQLAAMTAVGLLTGLGLAIIGVPLWASLAVLAAVLDFVPNFGPILASIPALLLALTVSPVTALYVAILYLVIQQVEGNFITPMIQEKAVDLPPVILLVTQVIAGIVAGPLGLIMATPLAAVGLVLVKELIAIRDTPKLG